MDIKNALDFFEQLAQNNNREWFNARKDTYLKIKGEAENFADALIAEISQFYNLFGLQGKDCIFRIYRDIRFSADKRPYKDHIGIYIARGGKKSRLAGYYIHLKSGECMLAGGVWCPEKYDLEQIRRVIFNDPNSYKKILDEKSFSKKFSLWEQKLKTLPKGFPKDTPEQTAEFIKYTAFVPMKYYTDEEICSKNFFEQLINDIKIMQPYNDFINNIIE